MTFPISELQLYPIKSLGKIALTTAQLSETGIAYDRYWMLVDKDGTFITQRGIPKLALFGLRFSENGIVVKHQNSELEISYDLKEKEKLQTAVFGNEVHGLKESSRVNQWFSEQLNKEVALIRASKEQPRFVKNHPDTKVNFSDSSQYLFLGTESMQHLNEKLTSPLTINRFRANVIFEGGLPHAEDEWRRIQIGNSTFEYVKLCGRCKVTTIDPNTAEMGKEPLRTLATYRAMGKNVCFGSYWKLVESSDNELHLGDEIKVLA